MYLDILTMAGICFCVRTATMASHSCCARDGSDTRRVSRFHQGSPGPGLVAGPAADGGGADGGAAAAAAAAAADDAAAAAAGEAEAAAAGSSVEFEAMVAVVVVWTVAWSCGWNGML